MNNIPVFLLPFAGANRNSYRTVEAALQQRGMFAVPLELPGRGSRIAEPLCRTIEEMTDDLLARIAATTGEPCVLFGHSMGALLAYRLALRAHEAGKSPVCLIVSGRGAPMVPLRRAPIHGLEREAFIAEIRRFGGSPEEILNDREIMEFFEPILRADFRATETYRHEPAPELSIPIRAIIGREDTVCEEDARRWGELTKKGMEISIMEGGHFHILEQPQQTALLIRHSILATL